MTRVLLTGASGFIASHILELLLQRGYSVRFTVRSEEKAQKLLEAHKQYRDKLDYALVGDIAQPGAFDEAVKSDPPFTGILHVASPFHFNVTDPKTELIDPAVNGTVGILKATKAYAPTVKRIVITSSFASIVDSSKPNDGAGHTYTENDWNPVTLEEGLLKPSNGYRASKKFAEKAAWDFVEQEKPNFDIATINPPLVLGPVKPYVFSLSGPNTSIERVISFIQGKAKNGAPPSVVYLWVDVRDLALSHILALEKPEAGGKRFFITEGYFSNQKIIDVIRKNFPQFVAGLPEKDEPNGGYPKELYKADNSRSKEVLGLTYRGLEESVKDLVESLVELGADKQVSKV
ncbi:NAD(P)-binding protein [Choiromyces venosus 120613-1]|uniref:NAD(P)-binding protein n=1 Tax=Choiromyces venosus 120613-1 TaxID=1336337 RepID=A0A3N4JDW0_9PEZI|nr:NAD(P)-binding protein [Choiromyces venosus 120613-1]